MKGGIEELSDADLISLAMSGASPPKCGECHRCIACRVQYANEENDGCAACNEIVAEIKRRNLGHLLPDHKNLVDLGVV